MRIVKSHKHLFSLLITNIASLASIIGMMTALIVQYPNIASWWVFLVILIIIVLVGVNVTLEIKA